MLDCVVDHVSAFPVLHLVLLVLGVIVLARVALWAVDLIWRRVLRPATDLRKYGAKSGSWAVVTGASDGIGKAYCLELAKRGFNVVLVSRTKSKLDDVAKELETKYKVSTAVVAVDMSSSDPKIYETVSATVGSVGKIGILVNNVGLSYDYPTKYSNVSKNDEEQIIQMNIKTMHELTRIVLPHMIANRKGAIINLSSFAGEIPTPLLSVYSGAKAYVKFFSVALAHEHKRDGIDVQCVTPGLVVSNMSKIRKANLLAGVCMPDVIVKGSLNTLGQDLHCNPFWMHALISWVVRTVPENFILNKIRATNQATETRALRKKQGTSSTSGQTKKQN
jgi:17beta-estradiol 17-dehydrogenase / very-long-chain 3-oxoacyl-CoA reductase